MKKRIILLVVALLVVVGIGGGDLIVGGFSNMRGFTTLPTNDYVPTSGGTMTGTLTGTSLIMTGSASFGGTASVSNTDFEFLSPGTTSLNFDSGTGKGTCLVLRTSNGSLVYARVFGTTLTINTTSCK